MVGVVETTRAPGCDFGGDGPGPVYQVGVDGAGLPVWGCRCMVCARCGRHTGNTTQGHYWRMCTRSGQLEEFHFCCPDNCELTPANCDLVARVVHACPVAGEGLTDCCGRAPTELPLLDGLTQDAALVTCGG